MAVSISRIVLLHTAPIWLSSFVLGCDADPVDASLDEDVQFRSGGGVEIITPVDQQTVTGTTCVTIDYACTSTDNVLMKVDSTSMYEWQRSTVLDLTAGTEQPDDVLCFDANQLANGTHTIDVIENCADSSTSTDRVVVSSQASGLYARAAFLDDAEYQLGDTITLDLHVGVSGLLVSASFAAVDSGFNPSNVTVVDQLDGTYEISYQLSSANTNPAGEYPIEVTLSDPASGQSRGYAEAVQVTYVPLGRGSIVSVGDGLRRLEPPPATGGAGAPAIVAGSLAVTSPPPVRGVVRVARGEHFTLEGRFTAPESRVPADRIQLVLTDDNRDGYDVVLTPTTLLQCTSGICEWSFQVELAIGLEVVDTGTLAWNVGVALEDHLPGGFSPFIPGPGLSVKAPTPPAGNLREVAGAVSFAYNRQIAIPYNPTVSAHPQFGQGLRLPTSIRRARHVAVKLTDGCGGVETGWTDANGNFLFQYETACPNSQATISVETLSEPGALDVDVRNSQANLYSATVATFVPGNEPQSVVLATSVIGQPVGQVPEYYVPLAGAPFNLLDYAVAAQLWTRYMLLGPTPYNGADLPHLTIWYQRDFALINYSYVCAAQDVGNFTACQLGAGMYIKSRVAGTQDRDEWELTTFAHEYTHYLDIYFMAADPICEIWDTEKPQWMYAFDEGIATGLGLAMTGKPWLVDETGPDATPEIDAENFDFNGVRKRPVDTNVWTSVQAHMPTSGDYSSGWVARIVWDLADPRSIDAPEPGTGFSDCQPVPNSKEWQSCAPEHDYGEFDDIGGRGGVARRRDVQLHGRRPTTRQPRARRSDQQRPRSVRDGRWQPGVRQRSSRSARRHEVSRQGSASRHGGADSRRHGFWLCVRRTNQLPLNCLHARGAGLNSVIRPWHNGTHR